MIENGQLIGAGERNSGLLGRSPDEVVPRDAGIARRRILQGRSERYTPEFAPRMGRFESDDQERAGWRGFADRFGEISELLVEPRSEFKIDARVRAAKNRKWHLSIEVEPIRPIGFRF